MKREHVAVEGPATADQLRLEFGRIRDPKDENVLRLEYLHDASHTGTFARVFRGQVRQGDLTFPVAIKLQRDRALSREDHRSVVAKFCMERAIHARLQKGASPAELDVRPVARHLELWPADSNQSVVLPPCILCVHAAHALAPRCPSHPDTPLVAEEEVAPERSSDRRLLICRTCRKAYEASGENADDKSRLAILKASVRQDPACARCPHRGGDGTVCLRSALVLNFYPSQVLLFELLDLDLDQYLRWRRDKPREGAGPRALALFRRDLDRESTERARRPSGVRPAANLLRAVELFRDVVAGVEALHRQRVAHLDLKLENLCLRFGTERPTVKVIDMGLADDPHALNYLRQAQSLKPLLTAYAAPEVQKPIGQPCVVDVVAEGNFCRIDLPRGHQLSLDPPCAGDRLLFDEPKLREHNYLVVAVEETTNGHRVFAERTEEPWTGKPRPWTPPGAKAPRLSGVGVQLEQHRGPAADVFSLGMVLLGLLLHNPDVGEYRDMQLVNLGIALRPHLAELAPLPGRALVRALAAHREGKSGGFLQWFVRYVEQLERDYQPVRTFAEELLGIVLRATLRGDARVCYLGNRGSDAGPALGRLRADLDAVWSALSCRVEIACHAAETAALQKKRVGVLKRLKQLAAEGGGPLARQPALGEDSDPLALLDLGLSGAGRLDREWAWLRTSATDAADRLQQLTDAVHDPQERGALLETLLSYCLGFPENTVETFLEQWDRLKRRADHGEAEDEWLRRHEALVRRLRQADAAIRRCVNLVARLEQSILEPCDRELERPRWLGWLFRRPRWRVRVRVTAEAQLALQDEEWTAALRGLQAARTAAEESNAAQRDRFHRTIELWEDHLQTRPHLRRLRLRESAEEQWRQPFERKLQQWRQDQESALQELECLRQSVRTLILERLDAAARLTLTRSERQTLDATAAQRWLACLQDQGFGPGQQAEADAASRELVVRETALPDGARD